MGITRGITRGITFFYSFYGMDCVAFTVIIDDIVFPDGRSSMGQLGGGGPQTLFGYQLASTIYGQKRVNLGLSAGVGSDLPPTAIAWLETLNVSTVGLEPHPTRRNPRAWQVFEADGKRTQIWRVKDDEELILMLRPKSFESLPEPLKQSRNYHIGIHPSYVPIHLLKKLREAAREQGGLLSVEPYTSAERALSPEEIRGLVDVCDIFSPNLNEAASILGLDSSSSAHDLANALAACSSESGAQVIVIRCGEQGIVAASRDTSFREHLILPAVDDTRVVDVTGCGNAFCGGFLASYSYQNSLLDACTAGSVSSSFMAEEQGVPQRPIEGMRDTAMARFEALRKRSHVVTRSMRGAQAVKGLTFGRPVGIRRGLGTHRAFKT